MGIMTGIHKLKLPTFKSLVGGYKNAKDDVSRVNINRIKVNYYSKDGIFMLETFGEINRAVKIPIIYITIPEKLGVVLLDNCMHYDEKNQTKFINVIEDYPFSLNLSSELKKIETKDLKDKKIDKPYTIPVLLNKIPREVIRINIDNSSLNINDEKELLDITQKMVYQLGHAKVLERLDKKDNDGLVIAMIIGILIGIIIGTLIMGYTLGT